MGLGETRELLVFGGSAVAFIASLAYVVRSRDPKYSVGHILLAGPLLFVSPDRYFLPGKRSAPWRALLSCVLISIALWALAEVTAQ